MIDVVSVTGGDGLFPPPAAGDGRARAAAASPAGGTPPPGLDPAGDAAGRLLRIVSDAQGLALAGVDEDLVFRKLLGGVLDATGCTRGLLVERVDDGEEVMHRLLAATGGRAIDEGHLLELRPFLERVAACAGPVAVSPADEPLLASLLGDDVPLHRACAIAIGGSEGERPVGVCIIGGPRARTPERHLDPVLPLLGTVALSVRAYRARRQGRAAVHALEREQRRLQAVLEHAVEGIVETTATGRILSFNRAAEQMFGLRAGDVVGQSIGVLMPPAVARDHPRFVRDYLDGGPPAGVLGTTRLETARRADGSDFPVLLSVSEVVVDGERSFTGVLRDVSEQMAMEQERERLIVALTKTHDELRRAATHDPLTGLANRALMMELLDQALAHARRRGVTLGVAFLDVDRFKDVNDTYGHDAGDRLLRSIASRLRGALRAEDQVARFAGDEFVVTLIDAQDPEGLLAALRRVQAAVCGPHQLGDLVIEASLSIGGVLFPDHGEHATALVRAADEAMYVAKRHGRGIHVAALPDRVPDPRRPGAARGDGGGDAAAERRYG